MQSKNAIKSKANTAASKSLELRIAESTADWEIAHLMLDEGHFLGAGKEAGDRLCQFVLEDGAPVAVLIWCAASWHPRALAWGYLNCKQQWHQQHGYEPLLAESFSDPESHAGTVYKVMNWRLAGTTKGYSQNKNADHTDYYILNDRPKKLWLKPLISQAYALMSAPELPEISKGAEVSRGGERSPLNIWRNVSPLSQAHRKAIGLRVRSKESGLLKMPGYDALNDLFNKIDPHAYAQAITTWLQENAGTFPRSLALDGKSIGDGKCGMIVTLCRHEDGRPVAMIPATGKKEDSEVSEGRALLESPEVNLAGSIVTVTPPAQPPYQASVP